MFRSLLRIIIFFDTMLNFILFLIFNTGSRERKGWKYQKVQKKMKATTRTEDKQKPRRSTTYLFIISKRFIIQHWTNKLEVKFPQTLKRC